MRSNTTNQIATNSATVGFTSQENTSFDTVIGLSTIIISIILIISILGYKKYRIAVLHQEIASLEKLWHLDIKK
ncbi:MAG: hypothetical protein KME32_05075 [Mojavia pulchra JT2-VF2]|jgi:hypothetical protein|uniref:Uncharacterized protein n=1 Tax=Mojavia pulchra JT2-VF2 TaxID=287848 RepID=A0A951UEM2_9NOST|nr:hypothetical protein [Mojavia pulchra JT2-VF2]